MTSQDRAAAAWAALNERQRLYLTAIYNADQAAERNAKGNARNWGPRPPASQWRWLMFSIKASAKLVGYTTIQSTLRAGGEHDQGAGSSLSALERRKLIEVTYDKVMLGPFMVDCVKVKLTAPGRAAARAGLGVRAPSTPPPGMMTEWPWETLAVLYRAGSGGMLMSATSWRDAEKAGQADRTPSWNGLLLLRDRPDGEYMEEFRPPPTPENQFPGGRVRITEQGRTHYLKHLACYRELHPSVEADDPTEPFEGAHTGLADHRVAKPRGLLSRPAWKVLAELACRDMRTPAQVQAIVEQERRTFANPPPAAMAEKLARGLLAWQIAKWVTRSSAATAALTGFRAGPLAEHEDIRHLDNPRAAAGKPLLLLCLTAAGRAHYTEHYETYRRLYDDMDAAAPGWETEESG
ncbi:hypothetical protein [Streptosporangium roseum]|uniref:hypothetical protein n=1 Tax=Streptosporangium roseum TaxID=2001 RepID=UPI003327CB0A